MLLLHCNASNLPNMPKSGICIMFPHCKFWKLVALVPCDTRPCHRPHCSTPYQNYYCFSHIITTTTTPYKTSAEVASKCCQSDTHEHKRDWSESRHVTCDIRHDLITRPRLLVENVYVQNMKLTINITRTYKLTTLVCILTESIANGSNENKTHLIVEYYTGWVNKNWILTYFSTNYAKICAHKACLSNFIVTRVIPHKYYNVLNYIYWLILNQFYWLDVLCMTSYLTASWTETLVELFVIAIFHSV